MYKYLTITSSIMQKIMPKYYTYNQQKYSICFPLEWAINHFEKTGPTECNNCLIYGCDDSIFKQYCNDCQLYEYMGTRTTDEYCHAATRQPNHPIDDESIHIIIEDDDNSDISDISSDEDVSYDYQEDENVIYDGISESKFSNHSHIDDLSTIYSHTSSNEHDDTYTTSSVAPILDNLFIGLNKKKTNNYSLRIQNANRGLLHEPPLSWCPLSS